MADAGEGSAAFAWRLLATLEGGSLVLGASALLAYTARNRLLRRRRITNVMITSTENTLGKELKRQLELYGCKVIVGNSTNQETRDAKHDATRDGTQDQSRDASLDRARNAALDPTSITATHDRTRDTLCHNDVDKVDALIVVGGDLKNNDLNGIADLMMQDVNKNLKLLESLCVRVRRGGRVSWACAGATRGAFGGATGAYDAVLLAALRHAANVAECEPVWVGRCASAEQAVERTLSALVLCTTNDFVTNMRNAAQKLSGHICRWLKIFN